MAVSGNPPLRDHSSEAQAGSPLLSWHRKHCLAKILPSVVKPLEAGNVCWELCCADELGRHWLPSCRSQKRMKAWGRGTEWVSGWVGVFLFSNKSTQNNQRFPVTTVPASLALLSKMYFSSHLHTYPSLYLNYQHLNFCGWLQPEFGSFRWE